MSMKFTNSLRNLKSIEKMLKEDLKAKKSEYNSNNGWGFGGLQGKQWLLPNGDKVIIADACYRHIDGHKVAQYRKLIGDFSEPADTDYYDTIIDTAEDTTTLIKKLETLINPLN